MKELYGRIWTDGYSPTIDVEYETGYVTINVTDVNGTRAYEINLSSTTIGDRSISHEKLILETITEDELGDGAVTEDKIYAGAVTGNKIGTGAVTENKIYNGAVTEGKIGAGAVTANKIGAGAVTEGKIGAGAVTANKIGSGAVSTVKIADGAVTNAKLGSGAAVANIGYTPQKLHSAIPVTLAAADWSSNQQTGVSATGVTETNTVFVAPDPTDSENYEDYTDAAIRCTGQGAGTLDFACDTEPTSDITVNVVILGV